MPKREWFERPATALLSASDGEIHTVVPGRPIGLHPHTVAELAGQGIHLHFYGDFTQAQWRQWIEKTRRWRPPSALACQCRPGHWVAEFSRYDAGWLHAFASQQRGEMRRANWDDLNYPARMATLAAAGVPMIQQANERAIVATQTLAKQLGTGIFFDSIEELGGKLRDQGCLHDVRMQVWRQRHHFTFDHHVPDLVAFFRKVIAMMP